MDNNHIILTKTELEDLDFFFNFQLDKEANHLAAFTAKNPEDKLAYLEKYTKHMIPVLI
jgi:ribosomal-protein-alanine N-acetyltransferase